MLNLLWLLGWYWVLGTGFAGGEVDAASKTKVDSKTTVVKKDIVKKPVVKKPVVKKPVVKKPVEKSAEVVVVDRYALPVLNKEEFLKSGFVGSTVKTDQNGHNFSEFTSFDEYKKVRDGYFNSDIPMAKFYFEKMDNDIMPVLITEYKNDMYKAANFFKFFK